jgi:hypothetical protein
MAVRAIACTCDCTCPMALDALDALDVILYQPFKKRLPCSALGIDVGVGQGSSRHTWPRPRSRFCFLGINDHKAIMVGCIRNNGVNSHHFNGFEMRMKLIKNISVPTMEGTNEKHDHQNGRNNTLHLASSRVKPSNQEQYAKMDSDSPWTSVEQRQE